MSSAELATATVGAGLEASGGAGSGGLVQAVALLAGVELLTAVLLAWRGTASPRALLSLQGFALAGLVVVIGIAEDHAELFAVAVLIAVLKGVVLPTLVVRRPVRPGRRARAAAVPGRPHVAAGRNPDRGAFLLGVAALVVIAYLAARPLAAVVPSVARQALPVGFALVLIGFALLAVGRLTRVQLTGFLMLDNGIATTAFLASGGVPLIVELGASLDIALVLLILQVLNGRLGAAFGSSGPSGTDLELLRELHD